MGQAPRNVVMNQHDGRGEFEAAPAPIRALEYMRGIKWSQLGTPEEALAKTEMARMLQVYQRFGAVQQPLKFVEEKVNRVVWEIRFPQGSRWANGPARPSAWEAMLDNYIKNKKFPGYDGPAGQPTDTTLRQLDSIMDTAMRQDQKKASLILSGVM